MYDIPAKSDISTSTRRMRSGHPKAQEKALVVIAQSMDEAGAHANTRVAEIDAVVTEIDDRIAAAQDNIAVGLDRQATGRDRVEAIRDQIAGLPYNAADYRYTMGVFDAEVETIKAAIADLDDQVVELRQSPGLWAAKREEYETELLDLADRLDAIEARIAEASGFATYTIPASLEPDREAIIARMVALGQSLLPAIDAGEARDAADLATAIDAQAAHTARLDEIAQSRALAEVEWADLGNEFRRLRAELGIFEQFAADIEASIETNRSIIETSRADLAALATERADLMLILQ